MLLIQVLRFEIWKDTHKDQYDDDEFISWNFKL
jgi:hypothetical protein